MLILHFRTIGFICTQLLKSHKKVKHNLGHEPGVSGGPPSRGGEWLRRGGEKGVGNGPKRGGEKGVGTGPKRGGDNGEEEFSLN